VFARPHFAQPDVVHIMRQRMLPLVRAMRELLHWECAPRAGRFFARQTKGGGGGGGGGHVYDSAVTIGGRRIRFGVGRVVCGVRASVSNIVEKSGWRQSFSVGHGALHAHLTQSEQPRRVHSCA
jgi:hypothetical protein